MNLNTGIDKIIPQFDNSGKPEFKKYLPVSETDRKWGFAIHDAGYAVIPENTEYPPKGHPGSHLFSWETGRILSDYHLVLITDGKGHFESRSAGKHELRSGDIFLLFPGEWHRYKPLSETGWTERWVGFSGHIADVVMQDVFFSKGKPIIRDGANMLVKDLFNSLFRLIEEEPFGYQRTASGICLQLLAEICNIQKDSSSSGQANSLISKAKYLMHRKIDEEMDFQLFCENHRISYSMFRAAFKHQTGFAPLQYFLLLKIEKAKYLLKNTDLKAKQIAFTIGFRSDHYFGRLFKMKTGITPNQFRKMS